MRTVTGEPGLSQVLEPSCAPIEEVLDAVRAGEVVIAYDEFNCVGEMIAAAETVTPEAVNLMARAACGVVRMPVAPPIADRLGLGPMVAEPTEGAEAYTVSIDLEDPPSTGISAFDRANCIRRAAAADARPEEFHTPGHIFPVRARPGGVLARPGMAEAAVDLMRLAGLTPAAASCQILREDGADARGTDLAYLAAERGLKIFAVRDLIAFRIRAEHEARRANDAPAQPLDAAGLA